MKLTKKKSIELCIELWSWLAETGEGKEGWPRWKEYKDFHVELDDACWCWFCLYNNRKQNRPQDFAECNFACPYYRKYGFCAEYGEGIYWIWDMAGSLYDKKKYAKLFLEQIKGLQ